MMTVMERSGGEGHVPRVLAGHFWRHAMKPSTSLKLGAAVFAVLWTAYVAWWSGAFDPLSIVMLTLYGGLAGYCWYHVMRLGLKLLEAVARTESDDAELAQERQPPVQEAKRHATATKVWTRGREAGIAQ
jgi:hypothetical protein